ATEVIKLITQIGDPLAGTLLTFNVLNFSFSSFSFILNPENRRITALSAPLEIIPELSVEEWLVRMNADEALFLLDVREPQEYELDHLGGHLLPLSELSDNYESLPRDRTIVVHCQSGIRSRKAVQLLQEKGFTRVYSLRGGLQAVRDSANLTFQFP
ncbi:rhodanese-like domain-containing protein, partial [Siphonobacter sp.]|uniref:rhodanese-like domain-containing protein n=1 Tax=Siphonobacter sp. TaxID=1869184 RepID=UPI003B3A539E